MEFIKMEGDGYLCAVRRRAVNKPVRVMKTVNPTQALGKELALPQQVWSKANLAWAPFLLRAAVWLTFLYRLLVAAAKYLGQL